MPGCVMAMARLNIPSIFVYGGSILPGIGAGRRRRRHRLHLRGGRPVPGRQARRSRRPQHRVRGLSRRRLVRRHVHRQHHEFGHRGDGHVAALTTPAIPPCPPPRNARRSWPARALVRLIEQNIRPRDIITRKSLENAYTLVLALGGSTNAVLHLMAIAREAEVEWTLADFDRLGDKVPHLADLKPGGKYVMFDLHRAGGTPRGAEGAARRRAPARRLPHRHRQDVGREPEGRAEHLREAAKDVVLPLDKPMHPTGHIVILHGNLAPEGAVAKVAGLKTRKITGPAKVFDGEEACFAAIQANEDQAGRRGRDPRRRPGRRARHARDAVGHGGTGGPGPRRQHRPDHRRPILAAARTAWWSATSRRKRGSAARSPS